MRTKLVRRGRTLWKRWSQPPEIEPYHLVGEKPWRGFRTKARSHALAGIGFAVASICPVLVLLGFDTEKVVTTVVASVGVAVLALANARLTKAPTGKHYVLQQDVR